MFRSGAENIFTGDGGSLTYVFLIVFLTLFSVYRIVSVMQSKSGSAVRRLSAGVALVSISRIVNASVFSRAQEGFPIISSLLSIIGFYLLMAVMSSGRRSDDLSLWNKGILVSAAVAGLLIGGVVHFAIIGNIVILSILFSCSTFAPVGVMAGYFFEKKKIGSPVPGLFAISASMLMISTVMMSLRASGAIGPDPFWGQLFSIIDVAGFFLFLASFTGENSKTGSGQDLKVTQPRVVELLKSSDVISGTAAEGKQLVDISLKVISDEGSQSIYKSIAEVLREETGADFVHIRTIMKSREKLELRAFASESGENISPQFSNSISKSRILSLCSDDNAAGYGYKLDKKVLSDDAGSFVPKDCDWKNGFLLLMPVKFEGVLTAVITAGFFEENVVSATRSMWIYSNNIVELRARENFKAIIKNARKELSFVKDELETANQLKSNFLSIVSHELRTPLTSVKAYSETLLDNIETIENDTTRNFLNVMGEETDRVIKQVDNILNYSSMENGRLSVEKSSCNLNRLIRLAVEELDKDFLDGKIENIVKLPDHDVFIDADEGLIKQLLVNLVGNAVKFTPEMGKVIISLEEEASAARIVVQDTGSGIPEEQLEKIFERFHQVDATNTREYGGSGLGLAICKNITEWHDGRIWVENVKDSGAKFVIILPMKDIIVRQASSSGNIGSVRFERERYLSLLVEMLSEFMQARKASIMAYDEDKNVLRVIAAKGLNAEFVQNTRVETGERIAGRVFVEGESVHVFDIEMDDRVGRANNSAYYGTGSFISTPVKDSGKVIGVLNVSDHVDGREFTKADREILEAFSSIIGRMMKKLEAYEKVSYNFEKVKDAMRSILYMREGLGSRNLVNYTLIALAVAERIGLSEESKIALRMGMNMYDLGMMKVPRSIRVKKEELTNREKKKLIDHPNIGFSLLSPMGIDERIMKMVYCHHEYYDGSGYPEGLVREEIPIEARIVAVVDSFRALVSQGPYRRTYTLDEAKNEVIRGSGTKFDPKIVGAFIKALNDSGARVDDGDFYLDVIEKELEEIRRENRKKYNNEKMKEEIT
ncbi:MAG: GAF domain-containing protein [Candidatus Krumholzibacteriota bacterium]|nr:GAF domain-containing protein [Candidatus Krumholzibacteriota bacterium]